MPEPLKLMVQWHNSCFFFFFCDFVPKPPPPPEQKSLNAENVAPCCYHQTYTHAPLPWSFPDTAGRSRMRGGKCQNQLARSVGGLSAYCSLAKSNVWLSPCVNRAGSSLRIHSEPVGVLMTRMQLALFFCLPYILRALFIDIADTSEYM